MKLNRALSMLAIAVALPATASAQNWAADPLYGSVDLEAGFLPDPSTATVTAGGGTDLSTTGLTDSVTGAGCLGSIAADQPDYRLNYSGGSQLQIGVRSDSDTTLLVNMPDGSWRCVDDAYGLNPAISLRDAPAGQYDIWAGTYGSDTASADIIITEYSGGEAWGFPDVTLEPTSGASNYGALNPTATPTFGAHSLEAGFLPDPHSITFTFGGANDLAESDFRGVSAWGFVATNPDVVINWGGGDYLKFHASADGQDPVMVIVDPIGNVYFNDDMNALMPGIEFQSSPAGPYRVWVGDIGGPETYEGTLHVTEIP